MKEKIVDIIGEMRMGSTGPYKFAYLIGRPDEIEVVGKCEVRHLNIEQVTVKELADRLDAALKPIVDLQREMEDFGKRFGQSLHPIQSNAVAAIIAKFAVELKRNLEG